MLRLTNFAQWDGAMAGYGDAAGVAEFCRAHGLDGVELIYGGEDRRGGVPRELVRGYHLMFYSDWLDFWLEDRETLDQKFGPGVWREFFGGDTRQALVEQFRADLDRAEALGVKYVVFHVSDVSIEETYSYRFAHSHEQVIDGAVELINLLLEGGDYHFELLMENLWWPGFTFTDPALTARMLDGVRCERKGIMLDTGHLMCANLDLRSQEEGCGFIHRMLDEHGELCRHIRGVHLHQSVTGAYVREAVKHTPALPEDYYERFAQAYGHIYRIDLHAPVSAPEFRGVVERIAPAYLVHELSAPGRAEKELALAAQNRAMGWQND